MQLKPISAKTVGFIFYTTGVFFLWLVSMYWAMRHLDLPDTLLLKCTGLYIMTAGISLGILIYKCAPEEEK